MTMREFVACRLFDIRTMQGLPQIAVAQRIGASKGLISHYELGRTEPSISTLQSILDVYGVSMSEFFGAWKESA
jgi:HTH-type transcriptional repressor of puuD